jgi:TonB family protein
MKIALTLIFIAGISSAWSQKVCYYSHSGHLTDSTSSYYYTFIDSSEQRQVSAYYSATGTRHHLETKGEQFEGTRTYYYPTGEVLGSIRFVANHTVGPVAVLYADGKPKLELEFPGQGEKYGEERTFKILNSWDSLGNKFVDDGNGKASIVCPHLCSFLEAGEGSVKDGLKDGVWKGTLCDGSTYEETYAQGLVLRGTLKAEALSYNYTRLEAGAIPGGGIVNFYKYVGANVRYPRKARKEGAQGKVFVEFIVNEDGTISDVKTVLGVSLECDEEAERVISGSPRWTPGFRRGKPVKQRMVLPITFRL